MTPRLPSFVLLALALPVAPSPAQDAAQATPTKASAIVFKLRATSSGADPRGTVVARLATATRGSWRPRSLRRLFDRRPPGLSGSSGRSAGDLEGVYVSDVPADLSVGQAAALLSRDPAVEYAQPDHVRETHAVSVNDPFFHSSGTWGQAYDDLWALRKLNVEQAWNLSRGEGVVVAVVDSGVDYLHPELASQMWLNPDEAGEAPDNGYPGDAHGWDFVAADNDPQDEFGHGTHMAGIVAAQDNNGIGIVGVAPARG